MVKYSSSKYHRNFKVNQDKKDKKLQKNNNQQDLQECRILKEQIKYLRELKILQTQQSLDSKLIIMSKLILKLEMRAMIII